MPRTRAEAQQLFEEAIRHALGAEARVVHANWGEGHRRMLLWNRRYLRARRRSLRNQPAR